jgi:uncharacterized protein
MNKTILLRHNMNSISRPDSPCIGICSTLYDDVCRGCGRTINEVAQWVFFTDEEKGVIWQRIENEGTAIRFLREQHTPKT